MSDNADKFELPSNMFVRVGKNEYGAAEVSLYERRWHGFHKRLLSDSVRSSHYRKGVTVRDIAEYLYKTELQWRANQEYDRSIKAAHKATYEKIKGRYPPKNLDTVISGDKL